MELKKRKSLILHFDSLDIIDELNKEQIGDLFIAIRDYNLGKEVKLEGLMKAIFIPLKNQFDRDLEKYTKKCEVNAINGSKGGRPKETQKNPVGLVGIKNNPKKAYNKNDSNSNSNSNKNNKEIKKINIYTGDESHKLYSGGQTLKEIKIELTKFIDYWNLTYKQKRKVTQDLLDIYKTRRKSYTKQEISSGFVEYNKAKKDIDPEYLLSPIAFITNKKNGFISYL